MQKIALKKIGHLLAAFDAAGVVYLHWKSNVRIHDSLLALTDLDLLVDRGQSELVNEVLGREGFRLFTSVPWRRYAAITDFYGFDDETGRLIHIHLHQELRIGQKFVKEYRLPWEQLLLKRRVRHDAGIYICDPGLELLLLLVRSAARLPDLLWPPFGGILARGIYGDVQEEARWLVSQAGQKKIPIEELLDADASRVVRDFLRQGGEASFNKMIKPLKRWLAPYRSIGGREATTEAFLRRLRVVGCRWAPLSGPTLYKRTPATGGRVIAVIGVDGSGKSTVTAELVDWLREMTDVWYVYMGTGDGKNMFWLAPFKIAFRLYKWMKRVFGRGQAREEKQAFGGKKVSWLRSIWSVPVAWERSMKLRTMRKARHQGIVVVADRYPQAQNFDYLDGPLLSRQRNAKAGWVRRLADWEHGVYDSAQKLYAPDIVIRLSIDTTTALGRKAGTTQDIEKRVRAVASLSFPSTTTMVEISARKSLEEVLLDCKKAVWGAL